MVTALSAESSSPKRLIEGSALRSSASILSRHFLSTSCAGFFDCLEPTSWLPASRTAFMIALLCLSSMQICRVQRFLKPGSESVSHPFLDIPHPLKDFSGMPAPHITFDEIPLLVD